MRENIDIFRIGYDRQYAIESLIKVYDITQNGFVQFKLFPHQKELIQEYETNDHVFVNKYRQGGITTTTLAYFVIEALVKPKSCIGIFAHKSSLAMLKNKTILDDLRTIERKIGQDLIKKYNKNIIELYNGSTFVFISKEFKGWSFSHIYIDEWYYDKTLLEYLVPAIYNSKVIVSYTSSSPSLEEFKTHFEQYKLVNMKWCFDSRFNYDLYWVISDGRKLYDEVDFTKESINLALHVGLQPRSTWYNEMLRILGGNTEELN